MSLERKAPEKKNVCNNIQRSSSSSSVHSANPLTHQWGELGGQFASLQSSIEARLKELHMKEIKVNERLRELESKERELEAKKQKIADLDRGSTHNKNDWEKLLTLLSESTIADQDELCQRIHRALELSKEPGKLVLGVVKELCSRESGFSSSVGTRICVILLEQLARLVRDKTEPELQMEALKLAREWKARIIGTEKGGGAEGGQVSNVVGFLLFLGAYDLFENSEFDTGDMLRVFRGVEKRNSNSNAELGLTLADGDRRGMLKYC